MDLHTATYNREGNDRFWRSHLVVVLRSGGHLHLPEASFWDATTLDLD